MSLGERLTQFIVMNRLNIKQFAEMVDVPYRSIHEYLRDERMPSAAALVKMCEHGVDIEWLLTGRLRPIISFEVEGMPSVGGMLGADPELARFLMNEAAHVVEEVIRDRPGLVAKFGLVGLLAEIWGVFSMYAEIFDRHAERFEQARKSGWGVDEIAGILSGPARDRLVEILKVKADKLEEAGAPDIGPSA